MIWLGERDFLFLSCPASDPPAAHGDVVLAEAGLVEVMNLFSLRVCALQTGVWTCSRDSDLPPHAGVR